MEIQNPADVFAETTHAKWDKAGDDSPAPSEVASNEAKTIGDGLMPHKKDETGNRYGKQVVVGESPNRYYGYMCWYCKCDCGNEREVDSRSLRQGRVKSCGCLRRGRKKKI